MSEKSGGWGSGCVLVDQPTQLIVNIQTVQKTEQGNLLGEEEEDEGEMSSWVNEWSAAVGKKEMR